MGMNDDRKFNSNILLPIPLNATCSLRRGFTFTELLALVAIIAIFSFTLLPVLSKAKMDFKVHNAKTNLSGFLRGLQFYQAQNNQEIDFGDPVAMGLPPDGISFMRFVHDYTGDYTYGQTSYIQFPRNSGMDLQAARTARNCHSELSHRCNLPCNRGQSA